MSRIIRTANGEAYEVVYRTSDDGKHTYEEIVPMTSIAAKAGIQKSSKIPEEIVARAEAVVENIANEMPDYVRDELKKLRQMTKALSVASTKQEAHGIAQDIMFTAHDLKGQGGSFGYPLLSRIAASLHHLVNQAAKYDTPVLSAITVHLDAITLLNTRGIKDADDPDGKQLAIHVETLTKRLAGPLRDE
ncbi:MAG: hypothetical protein Dbin4_00389 [Alphaproteobacteria bacterium]|nr:hypothetical protein [Alphaproteobacteria bacterium]